MSVSDFGDTLEFVFNFFISLFPSLLTQYWCFAPLFFGALLLIFYRLLTATIPSLRSR